MKKFIFFSIILFLSCSKDSVKLPKRDLPLTGKWILTETLADPGDGSGKWTKADKPNYYFIQFNSDKTINTNVYDGFGNPIKYMNTDSTLNLIYSGGGSILLNYKIDDPYLTITGGCYEACGSKFKTDL